MLTSQPIKDFVSTARAYCMFLETDPGRDPRQFLRTVQKDLLTLYRMGLDLPDISSVDDSHVEDSIEQHIHMERILKLTRDRLPFGLYWVAYNPLEIASPAQVGAGDLVDDLGDIYRNLKKGLLLFDHTAAGTKENAIWYFKFDYDNHWGQHCMSALQVIHQYLL